MNCVSSIYEIPFIYALDIKYDLFKNLAVKANYSTNYRLPTFNDLYWNPGGNPDLKSETSSTAELGLIFTQNIFEINITSFFINSKNLIQWQPYENNIWKPVNIQNVENYGIEFSLILQKRIRNHFVMLKTQYDYVKAIDKTLNQQLIYVPKNKANIILSYRYKKWGFEYNLQYTGKVFITTSNTQSIDAYSLSNIRVNRSLLKNKLLIALHINNIFDKNYQSVAYRPMPNRNFTLTINLII